MNRLKFKCWIKETKKIDTVVELYSDGGVLAEEYPYPISNCDVEVLQFSSLKDMDGNDIYEGFILARGEAVGRVVVFDEASFRLSDDTNQANQILSEFACDRLRIIGNIYENPELLDK